MMRHIVAVALLASSAALSVDSAFSKSASTQLSLDALVSGWYEREFGETIPRPAIFNDTRAVDCRGDGHLTTTAYLRTSDNTADVLVLYLTRDGLNLIRKSRANALAPQERSKSCRWWCAIPIRLVPTRCRCG